MMGMSSVGPGGLPPPPPLPEEPTLWASLPVSVGDENLSGLTVTLRPGARISGRLQFEGSAPVPDPAQLQRTSIQITANEPRSPGMGPMARVETDGTFNTTGFPPGRYQISAAVPSVSGGATGWSFKSAAVNGRDLADEPLEIEAEDISGIVITFTDRPSRVRGVVRAATGQPDVQAEVVAFPADSQGWREGLASRRVQTVRVSTTGAYDFGNVPAGDYYVAVVSGGTIGDTQDPAFLESLIATATRVTVADGETKTQDLVTK
jgi:hypothetical protein